jgi:glycosyltransferase involved in cell wall biosynthesis
MIRRDLVIYRNFVAAGRHWRRPSFAAHSPWKEPRLSAPSASHASNPAIAIPAGFRLSVVIPAYNERDTIEPIVERVRQCGVPVEIIVVDDGSRDGTREKLRAMEKAAAGVASGTGTDASGGARAGTGTGAGSGTGSGSPDYPLRVVFHERNQGKGAAVRTGMLKATGNVVVIQDADLEYDPGEFPRLLRPILEDRADIVYGSRFLAGDRSVSPAWHRHGNGFLTRLSNLRTRLKLTDVETCYKMFRRELIQPIAATLREKGFGIELEITAKCARLPGVRFLELPISYARRSYAEGKKIGMKDAFWALWCIARY